MNTIKLFFAKIRRVYFNWRVKREISKRISPHVRKEANYGYPFQSKDEMVKLHICGCLQARTNLRTIERMAADMPKFQGDAFRYVVYRDLNQRLEMYLTLAEKCIEPQCDDSVVVTAT